MSVVRGVFSGEFDPLVFRSSISRAVRDELNLSENLLFLELFHLFRPEKKHTNKSVLDEKSMKNYPKMMFRTFFFSHVTNENSLLVGGQIHPWLYWWKNLQTNWYRLKNSMTGKFLH